MAQATGAQSKFLLGFESAFKTIATVGYILPINSSTLKSNRNQNQPGTITGNLNPVEPYDGNIAIAGQVTVPADSVALWYWLKAALGDPVTTGEGPYVHTFKSGSTSRPSITIEHQFLDLATAKYFQYTGCKINGMSLSTGGDGELVFIFDVVGSVETIASTSFHAAASLITMSRLQNSHAAITEGGSSISNGTQFDFSIAFNCDTSGYCIGGGGVLGQIPDQILGVSGTLNQLFESTAVLEKAINSTESAIVLTFTGSSSSILGITFPEVKYARNSPAIEGPQGLATSLPFMGYYANGADAAACKIVLTNGDAHA